MLGSLFVLEEENAHRSVVGLWPLRRKVYFPPSCDENRRWQSVQSEWTFLGTHGNLSFFLKSKVHL